jgi:hypothetical protein
MTILAAFTQALPPALRAIKDLTAQLVCEFTRNDEAVDKWA